MGAGAPSSFQSSPIEFHPFPWGGEREGKGKGGMEEGKGREREGKGREGRVRKAKELDEVR